MTSHPNRAKLSIAAPVVTGCHVLSARLTAGHTQAQMAATLYRSARSVESWEDGTRMPDPALLELYLIKTGQIESHGWREVFPK